jgi:hypothetical protein
VITPLQTVIITPVLGSKLILNKLNLKLASGCFAVQVTASQLSLLEATMAKMERVAVWSLMSGGGSGQDVFTVSACIVGAGSAIKRCRLPRRVALVTGAN